MGDRAMCEIKIDKGSLFLYTHWSGHSLPEDAKLAIKAAQPRWDDEPYATRIIVDQLTKGGRDQETGFGIMLTPDAEDEYNNDNPSVVIDLTEKKLSYIRQKNSIVHEEIHSFKDL